VSPTAAGFVINADGNLGIFAGTWNGGTFGGYADDSLVTVGANQYLVNYNDTSGGQNFGGSDHANYMTLTAANAAAVPEASSFLFGGIVCAALAAAHFGRKLLRQRAVVLT
jgi:hypothetical protein